MVCLSTEKFSSGVEVRGSSWWGMVNKNKFVLLLDRIDKELEKNSLVVSTEMPNKFIDKEVDICVGRYDKIAMFYIATQFDIPIPKYIELTSLRVTHILDAISEISSCIKATNNNLISIRNKRSARGMGNLIISIDKILDLIFLVRTYRNNLGTKKGVERLAVLEKFRNAIDLIAEPRKGYGDYHDDEEKYRIESSLLEKSGSMFMQEVIISPKEEFRLYLTQNMEYVPCASFIGIKRLGYGLTEKVENMTDIHLSRNEIDTIVEDEKFQAIIDKLIKMLRALKHVAISVDLYRIIDTGEWGIFEYSSEYSIEGLSLEHSLKLREHINYSLGYINHIKVNNRNRK